MNIIDRISKVIENSIPKYNQGETAEYAISMTVLPGNQPGQFLPALVTVLTLPGVVIGERAQSVSINFNLAIEDDQIDQLVNESLESLRVERSKALADVSENPIK